MDTGIWRCQVRSTGSADGDFRVLGAAADVERRRHAIVAAPWTVLRQVHSADVVVVPSPGAGTGATADGAVTFVRGAPVAVTTADCAPVVLIGTTGVAVVHVGWRGALAGIVGVAADALRAGGAIPSATVLGPCIGPQHYEFGADDLVRLTDLFGPRVRVPSGPDRWALDLPATIQEACVRAGWPAPDRPPCTSDPAYYSHRVRADRGRQTTVAWLEAT